MYLYIFLTLLLLPHCVLYSAVQQPVGLQRKIDSLLRSYKATVGVAVLHSPSGERLAINNTQHYVMQSVFKFHLALTVFHHVDSGLLSLEQKVLVTKEECEQTMWSPLAVAYPMGNVSLSVRELLSYTISQSDNVACDVLFRLVGGTATVQAYMMKLGVENTSISKTEKQMHDNAAHQFKNWTTPMSVAELLERAYTTAILSESSRTELWSMMKATSTGPKRIKGLLPTSVVVAHKTGSSGQDAKGVTIATNDVGIIVLPNGHHVVLAVFVSNSKETPERNEQIIAKIARIVWEYYAKP